MTEDRQPELVGSAFHTFYPEERDGCVLVKHQGKVLSSPEPGYYLVQFYDWIDGSPNDLHLARTEEMTKWRFYSTVEEMIDAYDHKLGPRDAEHREGHGGGYKTITAAELLRLDYGPGPGSVVAPRRLGEETP